MIRSYVKALRIRRLTFEAGALFAGRMPMTSVYVGGGVTFDKTENLTDRCNKFRTIIEEVGQFVVKEYVPIVLTLGLLYPNVRQQVQQRHDRRLHADTAPGWGCRRRRGQLPRMGRVPEPDADDTPHSSRWRPHSGHDAASPRANKAEIYDQFIDPASPNRVPLNLKEDIANSRYTDTLGEYDANNAGLSWRRVAHRAAPLPTATRTPRLRAGTASRWRSGRSPASSSLASTRSTAASWPLQPGLSAQYLKYVQSFTAGGAAAGGVDVGGTYYGLDPRMIEPDIAVALVRAGLAAVYSRAARRRGHRPATSHSRRLQQRQRGHHRCGGRRASSPSRAASPPWTACVRAASSRSCSSRPWSAATTSRRRDTGLPGTGWIDGLQAIANSGSDTWKNKSIPVGTFQGWGATEAPRGALMHQCTINNGKITKYQCIVPTTWNMSPKDYAGQRGPIEQAMIGAPYSAAGASFTNQAGGTTTTQGGVEALRIAQSFDPCIACAIH